MSARIQPGAFDSAPPYRVGWFYSSSDPSTLVRCLAEGDEIAEYEKRSDFVKWCDAEPGTTPNVSADVELAAARWCALLASQRIRMIGSAGLTGKTDPNGNPWSGYAHFGMEIWTKYGASLDEDRLRSMAQGNDLGRDWLTRYADIAIEAQRSASVPVDAKIFCIHAFTDHLPPCDECVAAGACQGKIARAALK